MYFHQHQLGCLSHFSYLIGDETTGKALVVDPQRDVSVYLADARARGLLIDRIIETHFHADFLSGHLELAAATGAAISYGDKAHAEFEIDPLHDGQRLELGDIVLEVRHTPGHTPESISLVVWEHADDPVPYGVLTGDTLFLGDVGRPDLLASKGATADELATLLYHSLRDRLLTLPDETRVFPAHGAGSACGKHMSAATESTIGEQRRTNYALNDLSVDDFVAVVTEGQSTPPPYFAHAADANRRGHELLDEHERAPSLDFDAVVHEQETGAVVIDTRPADEFAAGHLRSSVNVGLEGRFAEYAGDVVAPGSRIVVVVDPERADEARIRLARIGFDRVDGAVTDVVAMLSAHPERAEIANRLCAADLDQLRATDERLRVVDVRSPSEQADGIIPGAKTMPMSELHARSRQLDADAPTIVYCASGYRSSAAASMLRAHGFGDVADLLGGHQAWTTFANR